MNQRLKGRSLRAQHRHGLNVCSMGKHVHGLKRDNAIAVPADSGQLAGERLGITGDVSRPPLFETAKDFTQDWCRAPLAWRIQDHGFGVTE